MKETGDLISALERLAAGNHTPDDLAVLQRARLAGQITLATGERAVALGGDATDAVIVTGDRNVVFKGPNAEAIKQALRQVLDEYCFRPAAPFQDPSLLAHFVINHLHKQITKEKNSKRYIPDVFVEVSRIKDQARFFAHPVLFLNKVVENIRRLDFSGLNRILLRLSLDPVCLDLPDGFKPANTIEGVENQSLLLMDILGKAKSTVSVFNVVLSERGSDLSLGAIPAEKRYVYEKVKFPLSSTSYSLERRIGECIDDLKTIQSRLLFLIARAGQGKTNFVCDFAENVLSKRSLLCFFFTGRELSNVDPDAIGEYMVRSVFGEKYDGSMEEMLKDLEKWCLSNQAPAIIIIDGINEHKDIGVFSHRLERLVERILEYKFVKLILTCRSEYFDQRFGNFREASFADKICFVENLGRYMGDMHKAHLIEAYLGFFKLYCPYLSERARKALERDTLLLTVGCI
jgi:hypothetical protein